MSCTPLSTSKNKTIETIKPINIQNKVNLLIHRNVGVLVNSRKLFSACGLVDSEGSAVKFPIKKEAAEGPPTKKNIVFRGKLRFSLLHSR